MELKLLLEPALMPMAVTFSETAARLADFGERERSMLALSVEELFMALCNSMEGTEIQLTCLNLRYAIDIIFRFNQPPPDLRVFNITSRPGHDSEDELQTMGLFLASRASDQFSIRRLQHKEGWEITLRKERDYPQQIENSYTTPSTEGPFSISPPSPSAVKALSALIARDFKFAQLPEELTPQGRLLDKVASGQYGVILTENSKGQTAGGIVWRTTEQRIVECFGPYIGDISERAILASQLCEELVTKFGRELKNGMLLYAPEPPPPDAGFEPAGSFETPEGYVWAGYRMMREEYGSVAHIAPELIAFYSAHVNSMALARDIREYMDNGETGDGLTLFSTRLDRTAGVAMLRPMLAGKDAATVLREHLALFDSSGFSKTVCLIDTGRPFDSLIAPHLITTGFIPKMLVPWGGEGDIIHLERRYQSQ